MPLYDLLASPLFCSLLLLLVVATLRLTPGIGRHDLGRVAAGLLWLFWSRSGTFQSLTADPVWAVPAVLEAFLLLAIGWGGAGSERESPLRAWGGILLVTLALVTAAAPVLGLLQGAALTSHRLPWLELLTLGLLLRPARDRIDPLTAPRPARRHLRVSPAATRAAAVLPLVSLATLRFGSLQPGWSLQVLFLIGFAAGLGAFADRPRILTPYQEPEEVSVRRHDLTQFPWSGAIAWSGLVFAIVAGVGLLAFDPTKVLVPRAELIQLAASSLVVAAVGAGAWGRLRAWTTPEVPFWAWSAARVVGRVRRWLDTGWRRALLVAAAAGTALGFLAWELSQHLQGEEWIVGSVALFVSMLILALHQVRHHVYVAAFRIDGAEDEDKLGSALAARFRHELASITAVHRTVDEALPSQDGRVSRLEVAIENIGEKLEKTFDASSLPGPLGKLKVAGLFGFARAIGILRGPELIANLEREEITAKTNGEAGQPPAVSLTVELFGGGQRGSWRITRRDVELAKGWLYDGKEHGEGELIGEMVRQAAYRVAARTASLGSPRWEALESFTEGLRHYRQVRLTTVDRDSSLRKAEQCFRKALEADTTFSQGHYNLGVVYSKLGEHDAALASFRRALETDPTAFAPYLALAMTYFDRAVDLCFRGVSGDLVAEDFLQSRVFSGRAIGLAPFEPRPWNVYGAARVLRAWRGMKPGQPVSQWKHEAEGALDSFRMASALAWRRLCRCELSAAADPVVAEARTVVLICMENLAEVYFEVGRVESSIAVLRQALRLAPRKPSLRVALGKALASTLRPTMTAAERFERLGLARDELYEVHGDALPLEQRAARWAWLLAVHDERLKILDMGERLWLSVEDWSVCRGEETRGRDRAFGCVLDQAALPESLVLAEPEVAGGKPGPRTRAYLLQLKLLQHELRSIHSGALLSGVALWRRLEACLAALVASATGMLKKPSTGESTEDHAWLKAQWCAQEARRLLAEGGRLEGGARKAQAGIAIRRLRQAIGLLRKEHVRQIRSQGLDTLLARGFLLRAIELRGRPERRACALRRALDHAFRGVTAAPESATRHLVLAAIHDEGEDHREAEIEREAALSLGHPLELLGDRRTLQDLYDVYARRSEYADEGEKTRLAKKTLDDFGRLRDLLETAAIPPPDPERNEARSLFFEEHAAIHFHLGNLLEARGKSMEATENRRIAEAGNYRPLAARRLAGPGSPGQPARRP